jgi:hypothetical protein
MWDEELLGDKATYENKRIIVDHMDITSRFTKEQASEYIDTIIATYTAQGYALADPRQDNEAKPYAA